MAGMKYNDEAFNRGLQGIAEIVYVAKLLLRKVRYLPNILLILARHLISRILLDVVHRARRH